MRDRYLANAYVAQYWNSRRSIEMSEALLDGIFQKNRYCVKNSLALEQEVNKVLGYDLRLVRAQAQ